MAQPFICHVEKKELIEPAQPKPSNTHRTNPFPRSRLGQGRHYTYLTPDPMRVHHAREIKQRLAADVVEDLIKFSFCHISKSLPPLCTDTGALITLLAMKEQRRRVSELDINQMDRGGFVVDLEQWCGNVLLSL